MEEDGVKVTCAALFQPAQESAEKALIYYNMFVSTKLLLCLEWSIQCLFVQPAILQLI